MTLIVCSFCFCVSPLIGIVIIIRMTTMMTMMMMMMTSKPLPGLSTVGPPPLPFVTDNLAILHCPARFHLVVVMMISQLESSPSLSLIFLPGTNKHQPGLQLGEVLASRWSQAWASCREEEGSQPSTPQTWTLEFIPLFWQPIASLP